MNTKKIVKKKHYG